MDGLPRIRPAGPVTGSRIALGQASAAWASAYDSLAQAARKIDKNAFEPGRVDAAIEQARGDVEADEVAFRRRNTAEAQAYNNAAMALSVARADRDASRKVEALLLEANGDIAKFEQGAEDYISSYVAEADPRLAQALELSFRQKFDAGVRSLARSRRQQVEQEAVQELTLARADAFGRAYALMTDNGPSAAKTPEFQRAVADMDALTTLLVENPSIAYSAAQGARDREGFLEQLEVAALHPEIDEAYSRGGLGEALRAAEAFANDEGRNRGPQQRARIQAALVQRAEFLNRKEAADIATFRRSEALNDRVVERISKQREREILTLAIAGELTPDWLLSHAEQLEPSALARGYNILTSSDSSPNDDAYSLDLRRRARRGEDVSEDVVFAVSQGRLTLSAAKEIDDIVADNDGRLRPGYDLIEAGFAQSQFDFNGELPVKEEEAKVLLDEWYRENPEATLDDIRGQARDITRRIGGTVLRNPTLEPVRGRRPKTLQELEAIYQSIQADRAEGRLDDDAALEALESYERWKAALEIAETP